MKEVRFAFIWSLFFSFEVLLASCSIIEDLQPAKDKYEQSLKVLSIGSSFGVNTFVQFPAICRLSGIEIIAGNLYKGACTLSDVADICKDGGSFAAGTIYTSDNPQWVSSCAGIIDMLQLYDWDIIILQRSAPGNPGGSDRWTPDMESDLAYVINYVCESLPKRPLFLFNSGFSRPVCSIGSREKQLESVNNIMSTAKIVSDTFNIDIIPSGTAIHNARTTWLSSVETFNSLHYEIPDLAGEGDHLDTGLGSFILGCLLFEQICGNTFNLHIGKSMIIPRLSDVHNNAAGFADSNFTQPTQNQAMVAIESALAAIKNPYQIDSTISHQYPSIF